MLCRQCGSTFSQGDSFCATCGYDLGATALLTALAENAQRSALDIVHDALQGDYEVKEQIGRGGMGLVFRALEKSLKREVALKVLPFPHVHDEGLVERFTNEARTAAKLEHPNVVPVYRVGRSGDVIYFTMRYLTGPSLAELIVETGTLPPRDIRRILIECAEALGYAHHHGVVHRDIKPDNVMFKESGEVVVCDFGIARAASDGSLTGTGMAIGTPYYMSPEQFRARPLDGRSDIYSLGVVGYQCLTKDLPFLGEDSFAIGYKHVTEPLPNPPLKTNEHRALYNVIARMTAKEPTDRYPDTHALIKDLSVGASTDRAVTSLSTAVTMVGTLPAVSELPTIAATPIETTPTTPIPIPRAGMSGGLRRPGRRHQSKSGVGVAAMALLVLGGVGGGGYLYVQAAGGLEQTRETLKIQLARIPWFGDPVTLKNSIIDSTPTFTPDAPPQKTTNSPTGVDWLSFVADSADTLLTLADLDSSGPMSPEVEDLTLFVGDSSPGLSGGLTGTLLLEGVDRGRLSIDGESAIGPRHDLPEGSHRLSLDARGFATYTTEIIISAGEIVRHQVQLVKTSHCDGFDGDYNALGECFDEPPLLANDENLFVPLDETVTVTPTLPAELEIYVRSDGIVGQVHTGMPSDVQAFTTLAVQFARGLRFRAARKRGQDVGAWTKLQFYPQP